LTSPGVPQPPKRSGCAPLPSPIRPSPFVLLSSHILAEVEALADRVSIIRKGRTVTSGALADLRHRTRTTVHAVTLRRPVGIAGIPGVDEMEAGENEGRFDTRFTVDAGQLDAAVGLLHAAGIHTLTATPPSLDDAFLSTYENGGVA
jgi:ABC-2 type transport system ATP-binding protein